ncbi:DUF3175 domain-containing protein [Sinorhizobium chiapasense]
MTHSPKQWSQDVTRHSNALELEPHVFEMDDAKEIAASLKRSADRSSRRKAGPFRSAMSMLTFYVNRAGKNLSDDRKKILEDAKDELRRAYGRRPKA